VNPTGLDKMVEERKECLRGNENAVDISRNFENEGNMGENDLKLFQKDQKLPKLWEGAPTKETSGTEPFSEWESKQIRDNVRKWMPTSLLHLTSGEEKRLEMDVNIWKSYVPAKEII
jgi:hypothetical protein